MKRMNKLYALSFSLLLSGAAYAADMGTPAPGLPSREDHATQSWTAEEQAMGEELMDATYRGDIARIEEILASNFSLVNFKNDRGWPALMMAAYRGHTAIVQALLVAGAQVNAHNNGSQTALMLAAYAGHTEIVQKLIAAGANVNAQDQLGSTPLMRAAQQGHAEIVQRLIVARADVNTKNIFGWSALMEAVHTEIVQALLTARALSIITNNEGKTALEIAQEKGHADIVELLQNHVDIEPEEETLMVKPAVD